jgi:hypothetical protein
MQPGTGTVTTDRVIFTLRPHLCQRSPFFWTFVFKNARTFSFIFLSFFLMDGSGMQLPVDVTTSLSSLFVNSDIALLILSLLSGINLVRLRRVSRRWHGLIKRVPARCELRLRHANAKYVAEYLPCTVWFRCEKLYALPSLPNLRYLDVGKLFSEDHLAYRHLTSLTVHYTDEEFDLNRITHCTDLRILNLGLATIDPNQFHLLTSFSLIEHLAFTNVDALCREEDCILTGLTTLSCIECEIGPWLSLLPNLQKLVCPGLTLSENDTVYVPTTVTSLELSWTAPEALSRLTHLRALRTLWSGEQLNATQLTSLGVTYIGGPKWLNEYQFPLLETLGLFFPNLDHVTHLCFVLYHATRLRALSVHFSPSLDHMRWPTNAGLLSTLQPLKKLRVIGAKAELSLINSYLTNLVELYLPARNMTAEDLCTLSSLQRLRYLQVPFSEHEDRELRALQKAANEIFPNILIEPPPLMGGYELIL